MTNDIKFGEMIPVMEPVSSEEEKQLLEALNAGSSEARQKLLEGKMPVVLEVLSGLGIKDISEADQIQVGTVGLIRAINQYVHGQDIDLDQQIRQLVREEFRRVFGAVEGVDL